MANLKIHFSELDSDYSFNKLGFIFYSPVINDTIQISNPFAKGNIKKIKLEEGLYIRIWNVEMYKDLELVRLAHSPGNPKSFNILFMFTPQNVIYRNDSINEKISLNRLKNVLFASSDVTVNFEIIPNNTIHAIDISLTTGWLQKNFRTADPFFRSLLKNMIESETPVTLIQPTSLEEYQAILELHESDPANLILVKSRIMYLVSSFFSRNVSRHQEEVYSSATLNYSVVMYLEKVIIANLKKNLPPLEVIARKVNMSVSSLKRHFKSLYNQNIYEYYLDKKMELAKRMVIENPANINEVASSLGYENVSHFIEIFKKHHGVSPGTIRG